MTIHNKTMNRKQYTAPAITVVLTDTENLLAAMSGGVSVGSNSGTDYSKEADIDFEDCSGAGFGDVDID